MDILTAIKTCISKYATFAGRASRSEFWLWTLFVWICNLVLGVLDYAMFGSAMVETSMTIGSIFSLIVAVPCLAVGSRRLHDVGRSGWWQLLMLTVIGIIPLVLWWAGKSRDDSKY